VTDAAHGQAAYAVRFDWGPTGAAAIGAGADIAVVVDVLSFTTTLTVAVERGMTVLPFQWKNSRAEQYAAERDAVLAVGRFEARNGTGGVSLSPAAMAAVEGVERIVLPSPNGSSICFALADSGLTVVGACLRNRSAVARWLAPRLQEGARVAVVAAGERWGGDGSLRPGLEDLWGAGAVLAGLDLTDASPEARHAASAFEIVRPDLADELPACASGAELVAAGFPEDVEIAAGLDACDVVPVLGDDGFSA
jgi:2-phosphosulfolactate phosphatase